MNNPPRVAKIELTPAQQLHERLGVPVKVGGKQANGDKNASTTKAGPGRYHEDKHTKDSPRKSKGAPRGFVQHTNRERAVHRKTVAAAGGIRQYKRLQAAFRFNRAEEPEAEAA